MLTKLKNVSFAFNQSASSSDNTLPYFRDTSSEVVESRKKQRVSLTSMSKRTSAYVRMSSIEEYKLQKSADNGIQVASEEMDYLEDDDDVAQTCSTAADSKPPRLNVFAFPKVHSPFNFLCFWDTFNSVILRIFVEITWWEERLNSPNKKFVHLFQIANHSLMRKMQMDYGPLS